MAIYCYVWCLNAGLQYLFDFREMMGKNDEAEKKKRVESVRRTDARQIKSATCKIDVTMACKPG
eukprot:scaffold5000_cov191-Skeletonema_marinoi.AAC.5